MDRSTIDRLAVILRRDLRLPEGAPLQPGTPLAGGDIDLDSLDILLVVTSIEKEFGIKIPNEAVSRQAFMNVESLARFILERQAASSP